MLNLMGSALAEQAAVSAASEALVRAHGRLTKLAADGGITSLAYASLVACAAASKSHDLFDVFEFQRAATKLLCADVTLYSEGALSNDNVTSDLRDAVALRQQGTLPSTDRYLSQRQYSSRSRSCVTPTGSLGRPVPVDPAPPLGRHGNEAFAYTAARRIPVR